MTGWFGGLVTGALCCAAGVLFALLLTGAL